MPEKRYIVVYYYDDICDRMSGTSFGDHTEDFSTIEEAKQYIINRIAKLKVASSKGYKGYTESDFRIVTIERNQEDLDNDPQFQEQLQQKIAELEGIRKQEKEKERQEELAKDEEFDRKTYERLKVKYEKGR